MAEGHRTCQWWSRIQTQAIWLWSQTEKFRLHEPSQFPNPGAFLEPPRLPGNLGHAVFCQGASMSISSAIFVRSELLRTLIAFLFNQAPCA